MGLLSTSTAITVYIFLLLSYSIQSIWWTLNLNDIKNQIKLKPKTLLSYFIDVHFIVVHNTYTKICSVLKCYLFCRSLNHYFHFLSQKTTNTQLYYFLYLFKHKIKDIVIYYSIKFWHNYLLIFPRWNEFFFMSKCLLN